MTVLLLIDPDAEGVCRGQVGDGVHDLGVGHIHAVPPLVAGDADGVPLHHVLVRDEIPSVAGVDTIANLTAEDIKLLHDVVKPVGDGYYG